MSVPLALTMFHWMLARNQCDRRKCWHTMRYRKTVLTGNTRPTSPFLHSLHAVLSQLFSIPFPTCLGTSGTVNDKAKFEKNCYHYYSISNKTDHRFHHFIFTGSDNFGDHSALRDNREISDCQLAGTITILLPVIKPDYQTSDVVRVSSPQERPRWTYENQTICY